MFVVDPRGRGDVLNGDRFEAVVAHQLDKGILEQLSCSLDSGINRVHDTFVLLSHLRYLP